jgi:threonine dehydratase
MRISEDGIALKCEHQQLYGSYKVRGIRNVLENAEPNLLQKEVVTVSAGNMARALAGEGRQRGLRVKVYLPDTAPEVKKQALRELGCQIVEIPFEEIWELVKQGAPRAGGLLVHPLDPVLRQGYGTLADEIVRQYPEAQTVVVPYGCGGLFLGVAERFRQIKPSTKVIACEADHAAPLSAAVKAGSVVKTERKPSFVDAIGTPSVLQRAFPIVKQLAADVLVATQEEVRSALKILYTRYDQTVEGAAGTAYAAALKAKANGYKGIVAILSGGNIDPLVHREIVGS